MCELLKCKDAKVIEAVLEGIFYILDCGSRVAINEEEENTWIDLVEQAGGLECLEKLQYDNNQNISEQAGDILDTYFEYDEDDEDMAPSVENNQFSFGSNVSAPQGGFNFGPQ